MSDPVTALLFTPQALAVGHASGRVRLGDREWTCSPGPVHALFWHDEALWALLPGRLTRVDGPAFPLPDHPDLLAHRGSRLALGSQSRVELYAWSHPSWTPERTVPVEGCLSDLDLSADGQAFLVVRDDRHVDSYRMDGGRLGSWTRPGWTEVSARFGPKGHEEVYVGNRGVYQLACLKTVSGRPSGDQLRLTGSAWLTPLAVSSDRQMLAARERGQEVRVYSLLDKRALFYQQPEPSQVSASSGMSRVPASSVGLGDERARVRRWQRPDRVEGRHTALAISGHEVAMGTVEGEVWLTNWHNCRLGRLGEPLSGLAGELLLATDVRALGAQGSLLSVVNLQGELWSLDLDTGATWLRQRLRLARADKKLSRFFANHGEVRLHSDKVVLLERTSLVEGVLRRCDLASGRLELERACPGTQLIELGDGSWFLYGFFQEAPHLFELDLTTLEWGSPRRLPARYRGRAGGRRLLLEVGDYREALFDSGERSLHLYDLDSQASWMLGQAEQLCPSFDGRHFSIGSRIFCAERETGTIGTELTPLVVLPDENLVLGYQALRLVVTSLDGGRRLEAGGHADTIHGILPSTDRRFLTSFDQAGVFRRWDLSTG